MGSKRAKDQVHDDSQTLVKYTIRVRVRVRLRLRVRLSLRLRRSIKRLPPHRIWLQRGDCIRNQQDHQKGDHKPHPTDYRQQKLQIGGSVSDPPTLHCHHIEGRKNRAHKHLVAVCQHCGKKIRLAGDSCDQRQINDSNGCKISGLRRASTQKPSRGCDTCEHRIGDATDMGNRNQCCPPQDCIRIQIQ